MISDNLGRYISNNTHLKRIGLDSCNLTDEKMALLFGELRTSTSLGDLDLDGNNFGLDGVRSMYGALLGILSTNYHTHRWTQQ